MKVALIGYGKMGKMIDSICPDHGIEVVARIDRRDWNLLEGIDEADVCIDFSHPESAFDILKQAAKWRKPIVIGTTGWYDQKDSFSEFVKSSEIGAVYGQNFSIGMNLFLNIVAEAAKLIDPFAHYDAAITEIHHRQKVDSPSGTAYAIAQRLLEQFSRKTKISLAENPTPDELQISSVRIGSVPGTHSVLFDSDHDTISLTHQARSRYSFAFGALQAAKWIRDKKGFYHLSDMMEDLLCSSRD